MDCPVIAMIPDRPRGFKYFKTSRTTSRTSQDHPGPPRITLDHHGLSWQSYRSTTDSTLDCQIIHPGLFGGIRELGETEV